MAGLQLCQQQTSTWIGRPAGHIHSGVGCEKSLRTTFGKMLMAEIVAQCK